MAYTYRSTGAVSNSYASQSPAAPAGLTDGDLMLAVTMCGAPGQTIATPTGWTLLYSQNSAGGHALFAHIADSVNDAPTLTWTGSSNRVSWLESFYGGGYTDLDTILSVSNFESGTVGTLPLPTLTVTDDNTLVYAFSRYAHNTYTDATTVSVTPEFTKTAQRIATTAFAMTAAGAYWIQTTKANYDGDNWPHDGTSESNNAGGVVVSLLAAATGTTIEVPTGPWY